MSLYTKKWNFYVQIKKIQKPKKETSILSYYKKLICEKNYILACKTSSVTILC